MDLRSILRTGAVLSLSVVLSACTVVLNSGLSPRERAPIDLSDPVLNLRRIFVAGDITESSAAETVRQLLFLDSRGHAAITLYLMTPGGDLKAAMAIVNCLGQIQSPVHTVALGECNSGGVVLLAAGTGERVLFRGSVIVVHGMEVKNNPPAKYVESAQDGYTAFWRRTTRLPQSWLPIPMGKVIPLTAQEALTYGIVDRILEEPPVGPRTAHD